MAGKYIKIFVDSVESWEALSDAEVGRLVKSLLLYKRDGSSPELGGNERFLFPAYKKQIDRENENYERRCEINAENGKRGGRPRTSDPETEKKQK